MLENRLFTRRSSSLSSFNVAAQTSLEQSEPSIRAPDPECQVQDGGDHRTKVRHAIKNGFQIATNTALLFLSPHLQAPMSQTPPKTPYDHSKPPPAYQPSTMDPEKPTTEATTSSSIPESRPSLYERLCNNKTFQSICRVLQCISSIISLILFAIRLNRIAKEAGRAVTTSNEAVMGILVAAVLHGLSTILLRLVLKERDPMWYRILRVFLDIAFVIMFIMVAELTAPGRGMTSGPCRTTFTIYGVRVQPFGSSCKLPIGTFVLAIFSMLVFPPQKPKNESSNSLSANKFSSTASFTRPARFSIKRKMPSSTTRIG